MGIFYKACNHELDEAAELCLTAPAGQLVQVPWLKGMLLADDGRLGVLAAQGAGIGLAKRGDSYKFYVSRRFAGWWGFEAWGVMFSLVIALYFGVIGYEGIKEALVRGPYFNAVDAGRGLWAAMIVGGLGVLLFTVRGLSFMKYPKIHLMSGGGVRMQAACINFTAFVMSLALIRHALPEIQAHGFYGVSLMDALSYGIPAVTYDSYQANLPGYYFWIQIAATIACVYFVAGLAWVMNQVCFIHIAFDVISKQIQSRYFGNSVVADMFNSSGIYKVNNIRGPGVGLCGAFYLLIIVATFI
jgi:hypothetical protein